MEINIDVLLKKIDELCSRNGITRNTAFVESGVGKNFKSNMRVARPTMGKLTMLANYFGVSVEYLLGEENNVSGIIETDKVDRNVHFMGTQAAKGQLPIYGGVAAGVPIEAVEDIEGYIDVPIDMEESGEYMALRIAGDSMEPKISRGDIVIVHRQEVADNGDIVIVMVNGEDATCKKIKKMPEGIYLMSTNPIYEPIFYSCHEVETLPVLIIGKVVELRAKF